jgi:hypothetical protein
MKSEKFTINDKMTLRGFCRQPWANDREIGEAENFKMSTVTACKNRMKREGIFKRGYFPAYYRVGFPLVSFSQSNWNRPSEAVLKALAKKKEVMVTEDIKTIVSFMVNDPFNTFVIANHVNYIAFKDFERVFCQDANWSHELYATEGATRVVNFNYTNIVNKLFFPDQFESFRPTTVNTNSFKFSKVEKKVFDGLLAHPGEYSDKIAKKIGVMRQSVVKIMRRFRTEGILEKNTIPDLGRIGVPILSVIKFKAEKVSNKEIFEINRTWAPFYYWVFDKVHMLIAGNVNYQELVRRLAEIDGTIIDIQLFDVLKQ